MTAYLHTRIVDRVVDSEETEETWRYVVRRSEVVPTDPAQQPTSAGADEAVQLDPHS